MAPLPWQEGRSILAVIRDADEAAPELPDEPPADPTQIRWSAGSLEGVTTRHFGIGEERRGGIVGRLRRLMPGPRRRDVPDEIVARLGAVVRRPEDDTRLALYQALVDEDVLAHVDAVLERLIADPDLLHRSAPHARWLVAEARHRAPVKLGIALLGVCGGDGDAETLLALGGHDEFTLYCAVALTNLLRDPVDPLWELARRADGWGKIEAVSRLAPLAGERPDVRRWLLTDGCENAVMNGYLAYACATAGGLAEALDGEVDDALLDGACTIVSALCSDGPAEELEDYEDGPVVVERLLARLADRCTTLARFETVVDLAAWLEDERGWPEEQRAALAERCGAILAQPVWKDRLREAFEDGDQRERWIAWNAAPRVGLDLWEAGFARLRAGPLDEALVFNLVHGADLERRRRVVEWAEESLPVEDLATGPDRHLFPAENRELEGAVGYIVQEMRDGELYSERLVAACLLAPVISTRNQGLSALDAHPRERWGAAAERALERLRREEPDERVREQVVSLLARPR